jgi:hypothetical protein
MLKKSSHFGITHSRNSSKVLDKNYLKTEADQAGPRPLYSMVIPETMSNSKYNIESKPMFSAIISDHHAPSQTVDDNLS